MFKKNKNINVNEAENVKFLRSVTRYVTLNETKLKLWICKCHIEYLLSICYVYVRGEITDPLEYKSHVDCQTCVSLQIGAIWRDKTIDLILGKWHASDPNLESLEKRRKPYLSEMQRQ